MKIFAYGSNMSIARLQKRVPSATKIATAFIKGFSLRCNKVSTDGSSKGNIIEANDSIVWGVLFEIDPAEKSYLDKVEGLGNGYSEKQLQFTDTNNLTHQAQVYFAEESKTDNNLLPYDWYVNYILSGAKQNELPSLYIEFLSKIKSTYDNDEGRRKKNQIESK